MSVVNLDDLENAVERLIGALVAERSRKKELMIRLAEQEARLEKEPFEVETLRKENARLKRNCSIAAEKIEELLAKMDTPT
ncbi:MAG: hypothetical protein AAB229_03755 [Candidatus Hydrogenedentota bacterium]